MATGFCCCCNNFALSKSNISNDDDDIPPGREGICGVFPGMDGGAPNDPGNTGEGEFERAPEGDVIGFKPADPRVSSFVGAFLSNLKKRLDTSIMVFGNFLLRF